MRLLHINLERAWRGGERQTLYLMEGLRALGHECHLVARMNEMFVAQVNKRGFPVHIIGKPFLIRGGLLSDFDIIHAHETRGIRLAVLWKHIHGKPVVATRRIDNPPSRNILTKLIYGQVDSLVVVSGKVGSVMREWGVRNERIKIIPDAIDTKREQREDSVEKIRERFRSKKVVGCVAALEKRKDHLTLLRAAALVQNERNDVIFVLIGDGALKEELMSYAERMKIRNVVFEGYQEDPYAYYPVFDVFVLTSKDEGLGSSILDAFFYRVPVVATAAGGIPELVRDQDTGLLADVGDHFKVAEYILRILADEDLRRHCKERAYAGLAGRFTIEAMAESYDEIYRRLLS
jgi:glycosyltransferase involved in cell wall biosynthesis